LCRSPVTLRDRSKVTLTIRGPGPNDPFGVCVSDAAPTQRSRPAPMPVTVLSSRRLTPTMVRVTFGGIDLERFRASEFTDSYVKLTFPRPGVGYPEPLDLGRIQASFAQQDWPVVRTYTVRAWDQARHELTIDFV